jgi:ElaA protein
MRMIEWQWSRFDGLDSEALYAMLAARQQVFILEQACLYPDIDGIDRDAHHLLGWRAGNGERELAAYLRCVPPGVKYAEPSLGRVLTVAAARGSGIGLRLIETGLQKAQELYPGRRIRISAQLYLRAFYERFGFEAVSEPYDEDGIPHIEMLR